MDANGQYPPPDFGCPPPNTFMMPPTSQRPPGSSNFHPSMWNWSETPSDPWAYNTGWQGGPPPGTGNYDGRYDGPGHHQHGQHFNRGWSRGRGYNNGPPNNYGKKQKFKKEPEDLYFCDPCDRGFKTEESHSEHMSQHIKCSFADCSFTAHEKIVAIHWRNSHAPGAKRIKLETQEEVTKWREERRRNYPTVDNVEKKRKVQDVREEGGGVLETAQFGRMRGRGRGRVRGNNRFQRGAPGGYRNQGNGAPGGPPAPPPAASDRDPLGALVSDEPDSDKEDSSGTSKQGLVVAPKQMSSGLGSLVASYGSMTESDSDEEPQALPIQRANQRGTQAPPQSLSRGPQGSHPGASPQDQYRGRGGRGRGRGGRGRRGGGHMTPQKRATLLEMLLAPDIRHERNVLLQCVRYVVQSTFFGLEGQPKDRQASPAAGGRGLPQSACAADEEERQTGSAEKTAKSTQEVSAEEPLAYFQGTSETEADGDESGAKETGASEQTAMNPAESEKTQNSEQAESVPMVEETQGDKDPDIATTTTEEVAPTRLVDEEIWEY
ncbi:unnamed protein product [Arctogadus glacialis]